MTIQVTPEYKLFDEIIKRKLAKNDAEISRDLAVAPPVISKIRNEKLTIGCTHILRIHEVYELPVKLIRELCGAASKANKKIFPKR